MGKINCIEILENCEFILSKLGIWPALKFTKRRITKLIIIWFLYISIIFLLILDIKIAIKSANSNLLVSMICTLLPLVNLISKSSTLLVNGKSFCLLLEDIKSTFFNTHDDKLNEHVQLIGRISNILLRYFAIALAIYIVIGIFVPVVKKMEIVVPAPFNTGKLDPIYKFYLLFTAIYLAFGAAGLDVLYITLLSLACGQLNILQERLENMVVYVNLPNKGQISIKGRYILNECIALHETINQYVQKLNIILSFPLLIQYTCGCVIICNTVLQLTLWRDSTNMLIMCGYCGLTFGQMAAYHWLGNEVTFKSNKIIEASYSAMWYELDVSTQKTLLVLMERAKRPLSVQLYKFVFISLESLGVIIRWAYSVFALMNARYS